MKIESQVTYFNKEIKIQRRNWKRKCNMNPISPKSVHDRGKDFPCIPENYEEHN